MIAPAAVDTTATVDILPSLKVPAADRPPSGEKGSVVKLHRGRAAVTSVLAGSSAGRNAPGH